ncbi:MAG TPA: LmeA family phospholipid-binding protein [Fimbriimonadaceae bacterium]|nr:LmeA family phospholipid-binding protein [Fimbriimonadaceae bacterium]
MLGFLAAGIFFLFGAGNVYVQKFENLAAKDIKSRLQGESSKVDVTAKLNGVIGGAFGDLKSVTIKASDFSTPGIPLFTEPQLSKRGRVRELRLELSNFRLAGLHVDSLTSAIPECRFDYGLALKQNKIRLSQSGEGSGQVRIRAQALADFILKKFKEIKRVTVKIEKDKVFVDGYGEFLILNTNFSVIAKLEPVDGTKLALAHAAIFFDDKPADEASRKVLLDTLNPVVDLNKDLKLHGAVTVERVTLRDGILEAFARTRIPEAPKPGGSTQALKLAQPLLEPAFRRL